MYRISEITKKKSERKKKTKIVEKRYKTFNAKIAQVGHTEYSSKLLTMTN